MAPLDTSRTSFYSSSILTQAYLVAYCSRNKCIGDDTKRHRSPKPKLHSKNIPWNAGICPIAEILRKTASQSPRKISLLQSAAELWLKLFSVWRRPLFEFEKFHIWSCDCHPNMLFCTKFYQNWMIFAARFDAYKARPMPSCGVCVCLLRS